MNKPKTVGLVGLGMQGTAISRRLMAADFDVWGYDRSHDAMSGFSNGGGHPILQLRDVGVAANPIILSLPNSEAVVQTLAKIIPGLKPGSIIIDTSPGDPARTRQLSAKLAEGKIDLLDASVLGSNADIENGDAVLMIGAAPESLMRCRLVLEALTKTIQHIGAVGSGQQMKLVTNLVSGLNQTVLAEGLHLAESLDMNVAKVLDVLKAGSTYSHVMDSKGAKMLEADFEPESRLDQHLYSVQGILEHAQSARIRLPLLETHKELLERAQQRECGGLDTSAIIRAYD